ncbi:MAG: glycosyltransferase, partial [Thermoanaerobaculia bacterium]
SVVDQQADAPRVSVLLRTKDRPGFLAEALDSLRRQTFSDFETILVNDGGPIPDALLEPVPGRAIRVLSPPPPGGRTRALNTGLAAARGTYVAYLDDDDLYLPAHLDTLVRFLDGSEEYRAAYTSVRQLEQVLGDDGRYRDGREITVYGRPFDAARLLYKNDIPLIGLAHRRALVEEAGGFDESFDQFEDWDFLIRLSARTRFHHLPSVTAVYRLRSDASNVTAAQPWHSGDAQMARRRLFEKHAARRSASTEMALVDSLETDLYALRDAAAASRAEAEALRQGCAKAEAVRLDLVKARAEAEALRQGLAEARARIEADQAALASAAAREAELRSSSAVSARQSEESASREQALAVQNAHLRSEVAKLNATLEQIYRSHVWRLFTPWWKLKEFLTR